VGWGGGEGAPAFWARYVCDIRHVEWVMHLVQSKGQRVHDIVIVVDDIVIVVDDTVIVVDDIGIVVHDIVIVVDDIVMVVHDIVIVVDDIVIVVDDIVIVVDDTVIVVDDIVIVVDLHCVLLVDEWPSGRHNINVLHHAPCCTMLHCTLHTAHKPMRN
jgi:hypothetical protein